MKRGLLKNYTYFLTLFKEQPKLSKSLPDDLWPLFSTSYQFVMTRCYGGDGMLHSTCLVPFGDSMNHHHLNHTTYCLVDVELENIRDPTSSYHPKSNHLDLT